MSTEKRIADLTFKYLQGALSQDEKLELQQWIESSPRNKFLFDKYSNQEFFESKWKADMALMERVRPEQVAASGRVHFLRSSWLRYAAAVIIIIGTGFYFFNRTSKPKKQQPEVSAPVVKNDVAPGSNKATLTLGDGSQIVLEKNTDGKLADQGNTRIVSTKGEVVYHSESDKTSEPVYNTLTTNRGEQFPLTLSDGTKIWLNAASSIRFPVSFPGNERNVEITGEAYFEVAKNPSKPFKVSLNGMEVTVLGTHFNVNGYADEANIKTTLVEGSVKIKKGNENILLSPGQQAKLDLNGKMSLEKNPDVEKAISWKEGYFHFSNNDLQTVMRELSRWYDVQIIYENEDLRREGQFSGDIEKSLTLASVLRVLEKSQVHFKIDGKKLIVIP